MNARARSVATRNDVSPTLWRRANRIVLEALRRSAAERPGFVADACGEDLRLRHEVESLLAVDPALLARFEIPALEWIDAGLSTGDEEHRIGPFEVLEELGRGGLAVVYLAVRAGGEDSRRVALKLLRPGIDPQTLGRRLASEGRILQRLRHPYVAELYGGGVSEDHRPYLVLEYVDGQRIDRFCATHGLGIRQRLELFVKVCSAVEHAHQNLVIHRDLKPSNILVTAGGEPRLLDFGISKLLEPGSPAPSTWTSAGLRAMTPEYASPEQILAHPVSTASDVYSLGVVLYELLTGRRPFGPWGTDGVGMRHLLGEAEPIKPSEALVSREAAPAPGEPESAAEHRQPAVSPLAAEDRRRLARRLRGDLDSILLKALRVEPERRYASVERLARDLRCHLDGLPVTARKSTLTYRLSKLVRRRPRELAAVALIAALTAGFVTHLQLQRSRLLQERDKTRQVADFLVELFEEADPSEARGRTVTVREVLDRSAVKLAELEPQPEVQASFMNVLGRVYRNLGLFAEAGPLLEDSLRLRGRIHPGTHLAVAESLSDLAALRRLENELDEAEQLLRQSLAVTERRLGARHPAFATVLDDLGVVLRARGELEAAERYHRRALDIRRERRRSDHPEVATTLSNLAVVLTDRGEYQAAEPLFEEALEIRRRSLGDDHPDVANSLNNLGSLWWQRGELEAAEPLYREALSLRRRLFGPVHPEVEISLNNLASLLHQSGRLDEADELYRESLEIVRGLYGEQHPHASVTLSNLAMLAMDRGDLAGAEPLLREAVEAFRRGEDPRLALALNNLGSLLHRQGRLEAAERVLREAYAGARRDFGPEHPQTGVVATTLAGLLLANESLEESAEIAQQAIGTLQTELPAEHWRVAYAEVVLGSARSRLGRCAEAERLLVEAVERLQTARGPTFARTVEARERLREHREACGGHDE